MGSQGLEPRMPEAPDLQSGAVTCSARYPKKTALTVPGGLLLLTQEFWLPTSPKIAIALWWFSRTRFLQSTRSATALGIALPAPVRLDWDHPRLLHRFIRPGRTSRCYAACSLSQSRSQPHQAHSQGQVSGAFPCQPPMVDCCQG